MLYMVLRSLMALTAPKVLLRTKCLLMATVLVLYKALKVPLQYQILMFLKVPPYFLVFMLFKVLMFLKVSPQCQILMLYKVLMFLKVCTALKVMLRIRDLLMVLRIRLMPAAGSSPVARCGFRRGTSAAS